MSAHRTLKDLFKAFSPNIGPGLLKDPGDAGTITPTMWGQVCPIVTAAAETRTLAQPTRAGISTTLVLDTYAVGACTVTVTGGFNKAGDTTFILGAGGVAGDVAILHSIKTGTSYTWSLVASAGIALTRSFNQPTIEVIADGDTAITAAEMVVGLMQMTSSTGARAPTVPTGTAVNGVLAIGDAVDWSFLNLGNQTVTITQATGHTLVGTMTLATVTSGLFRTVCTAANTAITYRLGTG